MCDQDKFQSSLKVWEFSHSILARCRNHFYQLFIVHEVNDVRHTEIHTQESIVSESSAFGVEMSIEKLKRHKSSCTNQIPAEMIKGGSRTIRSEVKKLNNFLWQKKELPEQRKESIAVPAT